MQKKPTNYPEELVAHVDFSEKATKQMLIAVNSELVCTFLKGLCWGIWTPAAVLPLLLFPTLLSADSYLATCNSGITE